MRATQPASVWSSASSRAGSSATSVMPTRPPGLSTRAISDAAVALSGKVQKAHSQTTASTDASGSGMRSASPWWKRTRVATPCSSASTLAFADRELAEIDPVDLHVEFGREQEGGGPGSARDVEDGLTGGQADAAGEVPGELETAGVVAVAEDQRDGVLLVGDRAAGLDLLRRHLRDGRRRGGVRHSFLPMLVVLISTLTWVSPFPFPPFSDVYVFDPYTVGVRIDWSSSAFGTIVGTCAPLSCSRTCSR